MNRLILGMFIATICISSLTGCVPTQQIEKKSVISNQLNSESNEKPKVQQEIKVDSQKPLRKAEEKADIKKLQNIFALSDMSGKYLIVWNNYKNINNPNELNKAIGDDGNILPIKYLRAQQSNDKNNNRELSINFDNMEGYIYEVIEGNVVPNNSYYLVNEKEFNTKAIIKTELKSNGEIDSKTVSRIEEIKKRKIYQSWIISNIDSNSYVCVVQFERQDNNLLTSFVYITPEKIIFKDYPSEYNNEIDSAFTNDDISPNMFKILFIADTNDGILLAVSCLDYESIETNLMIENNGEFKDINNIKELRYTAPL